MTEKPGTLEVCKVCFWEDDPFQLDDPDSEGWANGVSLRQGQRNFQKFGACTKDMIKNVRRPNIEEARNDDWKFLD